MNIFFLHKDPVIAARSLHDIHIRKLGLEAAQMLANCYTLEQLRLAPLTQSGNYRKHSHYNHPCSRWVRVSKQNFNWLLEHAKEIFRQFELRFGKKHFTQSFIDWVMKNPPSLSDHGLTKVSLAMPENYKQDDFVQAYRSYYIAEKKYDSRGKNMWEWSGVPQPEWSK